MKNIKILNIFYDPYFRIQSAHIVVIMLLSFSAIFLTENIYAIILQLIISFAVFMHHRDDLNIKNNLINSQNQLREDKNIFDRNIIISETNLDGVITYVNSNYCLATGYTKEELLGSTHSKIRGDKTSNETYKQLYDALNNNKTFIDILQNKRKDGSCFWVDLHISPVFLKNKKIGYKAIMFDITDKMMLQEELQHTIEDKDIKLDIQATRFEFAINSARDGFWDYDLLTNEFYLSEGWKKRLGFDLTKKLSYLEYLSLMPDEHRFEHHQAMHNILEKNPNNLEYIHFRIRYPIVTKNNEKLIIEDVGDVFFDEVQNPIRITGFHRDITDQERQLKIIESQNRVSAMGEVISNIAHQWRQPIGAINNTLNDVEFDIELEDLKVIDAEVYLKTSSKVKEYTSYLSQTINDFRKLTSDDKVKANFLLKNTVTNAYNILQNVYEKHHIEFSYVEPSDDSLSVNGYERELQQVLINLLNNAKDILVEKEVLKPLVTLSIKDDNNKITIYVSDNGGGIPASIIEKIFDPYFTTKHEAIGTGIGLYMSKKIITEYFDGSLEVQNEEHGAKFIISIPKNI